MPWGPFGPQRPGGVPVGPPWLLHLAILYITGVPGFRNISRIWPFRPKFRKYSGKVETVCLKRVARSKSLNCDALGSLWSPKARRGPIWASKAPKLCNPLYKRGPRFPEYFRNLAVSTQILEIFRKSRDRRLLKTGCEVKILEL